MKSAAYVAALFAVAYAWPWVLDVSPSFPHLPALPAVESLAPAVVGSDAADSEPKRRRQPDRPADVVAAAGPATGGTADEPVSGEVGSTPDADSPAGPKALRPRYPSGYVAGGEVAVAMPAADDSAAVLERQLATLVDGECLDFRPWREVEPVNVIPDGTCARYRTVVGEETGEAVVSAADNLVRRDDTPPPPPRLEISEASENAHAAGGTLFYRAAEGEGGTFTVAAVAADPQSGVGEVRFPALGDTASTSEPGPEAEVRYAWSNSTGAPTEGVVVATNGAGSESEAPLRMIGDADSPAGGFVSYSGGLHRDGRVEVEVDAGEDAVSGVEAASGVLEEQDSPLAGGRCSGRWGPWHAAPSGGSPGRAACVRLRYRVSDNVGNEVIYESKVVAKVVDHVRPTVALVAPGHGATVSGTVTVSAEAEDIGFGVATVRLQFTRSDRCHSQWRTIATVTTAPYVASWTTSSLAPGRYRVRAVASDRAGNTSASRPVTIRIAKLVPSEQPGDDDGGDAGDRPTVPGDEDEDVDDVDDEDPVAAPVPSEGAEEAPPPAEDEEPATSPTDAEGATAGAAREPRAEDGSAVSAGAAALLGRSRQGSESGVPT